jgi:hypothetical protein
MLRIMSVCLGMLAGPLVAQDVCPVAADLTRGIRIDFQDGSYEIYRQTEPGLIRVTGTSGDGSVYEMYLAQGAHLVLFQDVEYGQPVEGSITRTDYGISASDLPAPMPGGRWQAETTVTDSVGTRSETQVHAYDRITAVQIGDCTYGAIGMLIAFQSDDNYLEYVQFFPELGISYLEWNESDNFDRTPVPATRISVLTK